MTKDETLKLALEALEAAAEEIYCKDNDDSIAKALAAIREALAQPDVDRRSTESKETFDQQEPVAYLDEGLGAFYWAKDYKKHVGFKPLYTTPPQRKPLTDEEIGRIAGETLDAWSCARAIEAAHGIKE